MGVENAWSRGYSGKGVVVAVTDIGINTDLIDLQPNIDGNLCFNFINNSTNVTPEYLHSYREESFTDHGNRCASLIAAVKGNEVCSAGIAFNASIAALKMFGAYRDYPKHTHAWSSSDMMARSHVYGPDKTDIYSNSWGPTEPFSEIGLDRREAMRSSAKTLTTSFWNKCVTGFVGVSAATANVAGIIALALEARRGLLTRINKYNNERS
ncbi:neuroendocrine convertase 2-like [Mercenaria mercenaria]|uniref:neuroendocrine convertase 2-like n=1 Tax=Mercenaria mercenaria TaxID=6596 RepID=UPI00234F6492|nr:neuroendocrine convertase 2-like [Mercenaria mercenaria]